MKRIVRKYMSLVAPIAFLVLNVHAGGSVRFLRVVTENISQALASLPTVHIAGLSLGR
jgi:hypothetical protein